jgi:uncharacterized protein (DUF2235 family)
VGNARDAAQLRPPITIAVFSDGTGNSAGKLAKTNVWRTYKALDIAPLTPAQANTGELRQTAFYDDGVGTSSFKPLAILGGALGWGLKRNILDLYTFLCRNYRDGDRIYAFGFSRGAFTIRVLIGLVLHQGLLQCDSDDDLERYARDAYRAYRAECFVTKTEGKRVVRRLGMLARWLRPVRDLAIATWRKLRGQMLYADIPAVDPTTAAQAPAGHVQRLDPNKIPVEFIGVWDTVAAYGLPLDELTHGFDRWIWPLSMPGYALHPNVKCARHALALDDERATFHPLLWDECQSEKPERIQQVWFAGMHADVGGGYPDDALAHVPLKWMMDEAAKTGLRFDPSAVAQLNQARSELGPMHDSRQGIGGYYRYLPRKLSARLEPPAGGAPDPTTIAMRNPDVANPHHGLLKEIKIHESVINRIRGADERYAPEVIPASYRVVRTDGTVVAPDESPAAATAREQSQEWVWNDIWKRRIAYFLILFATLALVLVGYNAEQFTPATCEGPHCLLGPLISALGLVLPDRLAPWVDASSHHPGPFAVAAGVLIYLLAWSARLQRRIHDEMRVLWEQSFDLKPPSGSKPESSKPGRSGLPKRGIYRLRSAPLYQSALHAVKWSGLPTAFGMLVLAVIFAFVWIIVFRLTLAWPGDVYGFCGADKAQAEFRTTSMCSQLFTERLADGKRVGWDPVKVERGRRYEIEIAVDQPWRDASIATDPTGFGVEKMPLYMQFTAVLIRRSLVDRWFQPIVEIRQGGSVHGQPVEMAPDACNCKRYRGEFVAAADGEVFFYVNDAISPFPIPGSWLASVRNTPLLWRVAPVLQLKFFYANNHGTATITIKPAPPQSQ